MKYVVTDTFMRDKNYDDNDAPCLDADSCVTLMKTSHRFEEIFSKREDDKAIQLKQPYLLKGVLRNYQLIGM